MLARAALRLRHLASPYAPARALSNGVSGVSGVSGGGGGGDGGSGGRSSRNSRDPFVTVYPSSRDGYDTTDPADPVEAELLSEENVNHLNPAEVARLRTTLRLVREHVRAREAGAPPPDAATNPLIDPRSFELRGLPRVDGGVLAAFRAELPAAAAEDVRPVHTAAVWDVNASAGAGAGDGGSNKGRKEGAKGGGGKREQAMRRESELAAAAAAPEWHTVDVRTMATAPRRIALQQSRGGGSDGGGGAGAQPRAVQPQAGTASGLQQQYAAAAAEGRLGAVDAKTMCKKRLKNMTKGGRHKRQGGSKAQLGHNTLPGVAIDFRAVGVLTAFVGDTGKIYPRRRSGLAAETQKKVARAVRTARHMALIHPEPPAALTYEQMLEIDARLPPPEPNPAYVHRKKLHK